MSELQFDRAEFASQAPTQVQCTSCHQAVIQSYYEVGGKVICSSCRESHERGLGGLGAGRFVRAFFAGLGVAVAGSIVWYAIRELLNAEFGLLAIFIGLGVGRAVHWGSRGKGGWLYQLTAIALTYTSIVTNYIPDLAQGMAGDATPNAVTYVVAFVLSFAAPFLMGASNILGIIIIAFGLWQAWKTNRRVEAVVTGPYSVAPGAPAASAPVLAANV